MARAPRGVERPPGRGYSGDSGSLRRTKLTVTRNSLFPKQSHVTAWNFLWRSRLSFRLPPPLTPNPVGSRGPPPSHAAALFYTGRVALR